MSTRRRWNAAWSALGLGVAPPREALPDDLPDDLFNDLFNDLLARYAGPGRAYHTLDHLRECFVQFDAARSLAERPAEVELAIWFHDAVYETRRSDNEERSAEWAARSLLEAGAPPESSERVRDLVLATKHDASPTGPDASLLVDVDLSILGAGPDRFDEYEEQVRREYSWVPERAFREARSGILRGFLARPHVYATAAFRARLERRARTNLERSLMKLGAP